MHATDLFPTLASLTGARVPADRPIDGVDQSRFWRGETEVSARDSIIVFCAERLQAVKWRNYKVHFYYQENMVSPAEKLGIPLVVNLYTNPQEDETKPTPESWVIGPVLKVMAAFEASVKQHPLIPMGTPDPYRPGGA